MASNSMAEGLKNSDESAQLAAALDLAEMLLMAQEDIFHSLPIKDIIASLIELIKKDHNPELMIAGVRCLVYIQEVSPPMAMRMSKAVPVLLTKFDQIEYIDLVELCISALDHLSRSYGYDIFSMGGFAMFQTYFDFFSSSSQRSIFRIMANCAHFIHANQMKNHVLHEMIGSFAQRLCILEDKPSLELLCTFFTRLIDNCSRNPTVLRDHFGADVEFLRCVVQTLQNRVSELSGNTLVGLLRALRLISAKCRDLAVELIKLNVADTLYFLLSGKEIAPDSAAQKTSNLSTLRSSNQICQILNLIGELLPKLPKTGLFEINNTLNRHSDSSQMINSAAFRSFRGVLDFMPKSTTMPSASAAVATTASAAIAYPETATVPAAEVSHGNKYHWFMKKDCHDYYFDHEDDDDDDNDRDDDDEDHGDDDEDHDDDEDNDTMANENNSTAADKPVAGNQQTNDVGNAAKDSDDSDDETQQNDIKDGSDSISVDPSTQQMDSSDIKTHHATANALDIPDGEQMDATSTNSNGVADNQNENAKADAVEMDETQQNDVSASRIDISNTGTKQIETTADGSADPCADNKQNGAADDLDDSVSADDIGAGTAPTGFDEWRALSEQDSIAMELCHNAFDSEEGDEAAESIHLLDGEEFDIDFDEMACYHTLSNQRFILERRLVLHKDNEEVGSAAANDAKKSLKDEFQDEREMFRAAGEEKFSKLLALFPLLVEIGTSSTCPEIRYAVLCVINRVLYAISDSETQMDDVLKNVPLAPLISSTLNGYSKHYSMVVVLVQIVQQVLSKLSKVYVPIFDSEGVFHEIRKCALEPAPPPSTLKTFAGGLNDGLMIKVLTEKPGTSTEKAGTLTEKLETSVKKSEAKSEILETEKIETSVEQAKDQTETLHEKTVTVVEKAETAAGQAGTSAEKSETEKAATPVEGTEISAENSQISAAKTQTSKEADAAKKAAAEQAYAKEAAFAAKYMAQLEERQRELKTAMENYYREFIRTQCQQIVAKYVDSDETITSPDAPFRRLVAIAKRLSAVGEDVGVEPLIELKALLTEKKSGDMTAFQFNQSEVFVALWKYLTDDESATANADKEKGAADMNVLLPYRNERLRRFVNVFIGDRYKANVAEVFPDDDSNLESFKNLIAKVLFAIGQLERFQLRVTQISFQDQDGVMAQGFSTAAVTTSTATTTSTSTTTTSATTPTTSATTPTTSSTTPTTSSKPDENGNAQQEHRLSPPSRKMAKVDISQSSSSTKTPTQKPADSYSADSAMDFTMDSTGTSEHIKDNNGKVLRSALDYTLDSTKMIDGTALSNDPSVHCLALLKALFGINSFAWCLVKGKLNRLGTNRSTILPSNHFLSAKLDSKATRQLTDILCVVTGRLPSWLKQLMIEMPFLFNFSTRVNYLHCTAFGGERALRHLFKESDEDRNRLYNTLVGKLVPEVRRRKATIKREMLLEESEKLFNSLGNESEVLDVMFEGEVGSGHGPTLEFYSSLSKELQRHSLALWKGVSVSENAMDAESTDAEKTENDQNFTMGESGLYPCSVTTPSTTVNVSELEGRLKIFRFVGRLFGQALIDSRLLDIPLVPSIFKWLVGHEKRLDFTDFARVEPTIYKSLCKIVSMEDVELEKLEMYFTYPGLDFELMENGSTTLVNRSNLYKFVKLICEWRLRVGIQAEMEAMRSGFRAVVLKPDVLQIFTIDEIEQLFCGCLDDERESYTSKDFAIWSKEALRKSLRTDHGYSAESPQFGWLIDMLNVFPRSQKRNFLQFVTGSPRLPIGGFAALTPPLTVVRKGITDFQELPSAMTCFNYLKLPAYDSYESLVERFLVALQFTHSFHLS